jgi:hypothetical protein
MYSNDAQNNKNLRHLLSFKFLNQDSKSSKCYAQFRDPVLKGSILLCTLVIKFYRYRQHNYKFVGFEVLTAVSTKMAVFWVVAPCSDDSSP